MENTITIEGWQGRRDKGVPERQLLAILYSAQDKTQKQIARHMGISEDAVGKRLTEARFKLGMQRSVRGLVVEAMRRGIIAPLALALMIGAGHLPQPPIVRRPAVPRTYSQVRIARKVDEMPMVA